MKWTKTAPELVELLFAKAPNNTMTVEELKAAIVASEYKADSLPVYLTCLRTAGRSIKTIREGKKAVAYQMLTGMTVESVAVATVAAKKMSVAKDPVKRIVATPAKIIQSTGYVKPEKTYDYDLDDKKRTTPTLIDSNTYVDPGFDEDNWPIMPEFLKRGKISIEDI